MPSRKEMIKALQEQDKSSMPSREQMIADLQAQDAQQPQQDDSFLNKTFMGAKIGEDILRPTLQGAGAAVGGLAGLASPLPGGAVIGGGAGYAGGEALYDLISGQSPKTTGEAITRTGGDILEGTTMEMGGQLLGPLAKGASKLIPATGKSAVKSLYNVPKEALERIMQKPEQIMQASKEDAYSGGLKMLNEFLEAKKSRVSEINQGLQGVLKNAEAQGKTVDLKTIIDDLVKDAGSIKSFTETANKEKQEILSTVKGLSEYIQQSGTSKIPIMDAQILKQQLQREAYPTNELGVQFYRKDPVGKSLKKASNTVKSLIEKEIPEVSSYNKQLKDILDVETNKSFQSAFSEKGIERTMKNIQSPSGNKGYLQDLVKQIDEAVGSNLGETTLDYFAAKYLQPGEGISSFMTGRAAWPSAMGYMLGGPAGGITGAVAGSPATFRAMAPHLGKLTPLSEGLIQGAQSPGAEALYKTLPYILGRDTGGQ